MRDHIGYTLQFAVRGALLIHQQGCFAVCNGCQVFHGPGGKVRNGEQVQLVAGIGDPIVALKKGERCRRNVLAKSSEMPFPRNGPQAKRGLADHHRFGRLDPAYDECDQVGGHFNCIGEAQYLLLDPHAFRMRSWCWRPRLTLDR